MYLKPDEVDIKDPPIIDNNMNNKDASKFDVYVLIPEVETEEVIERNTLAIPSLGIIKK